jgi:hypothetical protein
MCMCVSVYVHCVYVHTSPLKTVARSRDKNVEAEDSCPGWFPYSCPAAPPAAPPAVNSRAIHTYGWRASPLTSTHIIAGGHPCPLHHPTVTIIIAQRVSIGAEDE